MRPDVAMRCRAVGCNDISRHPAVKPDGLRQHNTMCSGKVPLYEAKPDTMQRLHVMRLYRTERPYVITRDLMLCNGNPERHWLRPSDTSFSGRNKTSRNEVVAWVAIRRVFVTFSGTTNRSTTLHHGVVMPNVTRCYGDMKLCQILLDAVVGSYLVQLARVVRRDAMRWNIMMRPNVMPLGMTVFSGSISHRTTTLSGSLCSDSTGLHKTMCGGMVSRYEIKRDRVVRRDSMKCYAVVYFNLIAMKRSGGIRCSESGFHKVVPSYLMKRSGKTRRAKARQCGITIPYVATLSGLTTHCSVKSYRVLHNLAVLLYVISLYLAASQIATSRNGVVP